MKVTVLSYRHPGLVLYSHTLADNHKYFIDAW